MLLRGPILYGGAFVSGGEGFSGRKSVDILFCVEGIGRLGKGREEGFSGGEAIDFGVRKAGFEYLAGGGAGFSIAIGTVARARGLVRLSGGRANCCCPSSWSTRS